MEFQENFMLLVATLVALTGLVASIEGQSPPTSADCTGPDPFSDPASCSSYYQCFLAETGYALMHFDCPPGGRWADGTCVEGRCEESTTTPIPTTTPAPNPTTSRLPVIVECNTADPFPYPGSCTKYYNCLLLEGSFVHYVFECQPGSYFNPDTHLCTTGQCPSEEFEKAVDTSSTRASTTNPNSQANIFAVSTCSTVGMFPDPIDCQAYYQCVRINGRLYQYNYHCPAGTYWGTAYNRCVVGTCPTAPPA